MRLAAGSRATLLVWLVVGAGAAACVGRDVAAHRGHPAEESSAAAVVREGARRTVSPGAPLAGRLRVAPAEARAVAPTLSAPATVEAEPKRTARVSTPLAGRVLEVMVARGDAVAVGQPLVRLDSPDLVAAQADHLKAKSARQQAARVLSRQRDLARHGVGARRELEQAETDRDIADDELARAAQHLRQLGVSPGRAGELLVLRAPIAGRVVDVQVAPGEVHNDPTVPLLTVADLSLVWVVAHVQEKDVGAVAQGDAARIDFAAYPGREVLGKVALVADLLEPDSRTVAVRVRLDNPARDFKPGMFATATFTGVAQEAVVVPSTALVIDGVATYLFVELAPGVFERRRVEVAAADGPDRVRVVLGLAVGERLVHTNAVLLD